MSQIPQCFQAYGNEACRGMQLIISTCTARHHCTSMLQVVLLGMQFGSAVNSSASYSCPTKKHTIQDVFHHLVQLAFKFNVSANFFISLSFPRQTSPSLHTVRSLQQPARSLFCIEFSTQTSQPHADRILNFNLRPDIKSCLLAGYSGEGS